MSSLRKNTFAHSSQGHPPVPTARATENPDRTAWQALVYNRKNGLGRGGRLTDREPSPLQLTTFQEKKPVGKRFCPGKFVQVSKFEANVPCWGLNSTPS